jgi:hypothetical protein
MGERQTSCGEPGYYYGANSTGDAESLVSFGFATGYILDATGVGSYKPDDGEPVLRFSRCMY